MLGLALPLGTTWRTVRRSILPLLNAMADGPARFDGVTSATNTSRWFVSLDGSREPGLLALGELIGGGLTNPHLTSGEPDNAGQQRLRSPEIATGNSRQLSFSGDLDRP